MAKPLADELVQILAEAAPRGPAAATLLERELEAAPWQSRGKDGNQNRRLWATGAESLAAGWALPRLCREVLAQLMASIHEGRGAPGIAPPAPRRRGAPKKKKTPLGALVEKLKVERPAKSRDARRGAETPLEARARELHLSPRTLSRKRAKYKN